MLSISLEPEEYVVIGDVVVKFTRADRGRCFLAIQADKSVPIIRGAILERNGMPPPPCIQSSRKNRAK